MSSGCVPMIRDSSTPDYDIFADRTWSLVAIMFFSKTFVSYSQLAVCFALTCINKNVRERKTFVLLSL